jgi:hypothetical protein
MARSRTARSGRDPGRGVAATAAPGHRPLTLAQWLPVLAAPVLLFAAEEARKAAIRRHRRMVAGSIGPAPAGQGTLKRRTTAG